MNSEGGEKPWQEIEVEQGRKSAKKKKMKNTEIQEKIGMIGIEACINRLSISLPRDKPIL